MRVRGAGRLWCLVRSRRSEGEGEGEEAVEWRAEEEVAAWLSQQEQGERGKKGQGAAAGTTGAWGVESNRGTADTKD